MVKSPQMIEVPGFSESQPYLPKFEPDLKLPKSIRFDHNGKCFVQFANKIIEPTTKTLPTNLGTLLNFFHIARVSEENLYPGLLGICDPIDRLRQGSSKYYELIINNSSPETEKRFSLAHEMGHILFDSYKKRLSLDYVKKEELASAIARVILAPASLVVDELKKTEGEEPLLRFAALYRKTQMPANELAKRLINDLCYLGLMDENFIIFPLHKELREDWVISNDPDFHVERPFCNYYLRNIYLHGAPEGKCSNPDSSTALTKNREKEGWIDLWNIEVKGTVLGEHKNEIFSPEFVVCTFKKLAKIAEAKDVDNFNPRLTSDALRFI